MVEYVGYYESHIGHYMPIIVLVLENDQKEFKEMKKEDILRIPDHRNAPGDWLYKKGQSIRESWQKRYMLVRYSSSSYNTLDYSRLLFAADRGAYLFYFHNHQSDRPVGVIPLENCMIVEPPGGIFLTLLHFRKQSSDNSHQVPKVSLSNDFFVRMMDMNLKYVIQQDEVFNFMQQVKRNESIGSNC
jgi:hypothetical protein